MKSYSIDNRKWDIVVALEMALRVKEESVGRHTAFNLGDPKWYDPSSHSSFHDSWVIDVKFGFRSLEELKKPSRSMCIRLLGAYHDCVIEIDYKDVLQAKNFSADVLAQNYEILAHEFEYVKDGIMHRMILTNDVELEILSSYVHISERAL